MEAKTIRTNKSIEEIDNRNDANRSRLVHHVGPAGAGLFPGWGPKL